MYEFLNFAPNPDLFTIIGVFTGGKFKILCRYDTHLSYYILQYVIICCNCFVIFFFKKLDVITEADRNLHPASATNKTNEKHNLSRPLDFPKMLEKFFVFQYFVLEISEIQKGYFFLHEKNSM